MSEQYEPKEGDVVAFISEPNCGRFIIMLFTGESLTPGDEEYTIERVGPRSASLYTDDGEPRLCSIRYLRDFISTAMRDGKQVWPVEQPTKFKEGDYVLRRGIGPYRIKGISDSETGRKAYLLEELDRNWDGWEDECDLTLYEEPDFDTLMKLWFDCQRVAEQRCFDAWAVYIDRIRKKYRLIPKDQEGE